MLPPIRSLSLRLLLVFIAITSVTLLVVTALFSSGVRTEWRQSIRPHLEQYVRYVHHDLGDPPSIEQADALAHTLPVDIHIYHAGKHQHSTNNKPLDLQQLTFRRVPPPRGRFAKSKRHSSDVKPHPPIALKFANSETRTIVNIPMSDHDVYVELDRRMGARGSHKAHIWVVPLALAVLMGILYWLLRQQLSPISDIKHAVTRMASGELSHRIPIRRKDDLGQLGESVNSLAAQIQQLLDAKRELLLSVSHELRSYSMIYACSIHLLNLSSNQSACKASTLR